MPQLADTYEIRPGDTMSGIANRFGITLQKLLEANQQIHNPNLITVGQKINIPSTAPTPPPIIPAPGHAAIYDGVHPAPGTVSTNRSNYINPPLTNLPGQRDPAVYSQLIDQFAVQFNPRYLAGRGNTYCNIFVWDVSRAMGAEIAHWIDSSGNIAVPFAPHANEININGGVNWMNDHGVTQRGWKVTTAPEAQNAANQGLLAVVMWKNPTGGHGHTAVVRPGSINDKGPVIAQAGRHNFNEGHVVNGFGNLPHLQYFWHD
jgi:LysM repeat protein